MKKRINSRGIIIENNLIVTIFRRKIKEDGTIKEYYVIPGGGLEKNETLEENVIRELKEELSVDVKVIDYLGLKEDNNSITHYYSCSIIKGDLSLGGPEFKKNCNTNYYEIRQVKIKDLDKIDISSKDIIKKAINKKYKK